VYLVKSMLFQVGSR